MESGLSSIALECTFDRNGVYTVRETGNVYASAAARTSRRGIPFSDFLNDVFDPVNVIAEREGNDQV